MYSKFFVSCIQPDSSKRLSENPHILLPYPVYKLSSADVTAFTYIDFKHVLFVASVSR